MMTAAFPTDMQQDILLVALFIVLFLLLFWVA